MSDDEYEDEDEVQVEFDDEDINEDDEDDDEEEDKNKIVNDEDDEDDENDEDEDIIIFEERYKKKRSKFHSNLKKISMFEENKMISELAIKISESKIFIPSEYEKILDLKKGDSIDIAFQWVKNRKTIPLPLSVAREILGSTTEYLKPENLITESDCDFTGVDF
jgi:hypothetical protein